jgi:hypothetical protein
MREDVGGLPGGFRSQTPTLRVHVVLWEECWLEMYNRFSAPPCILSALNTTALFSLIV